MRGQRKLTPEIYQLIPQLIGQGKTKQEIADSYGVTKATLQVQCSRRGISLRPGGRRQRVIVPVVVEHPPAVTEAAQIVSLRLEAKARGMRGELDLVSQLLDVIVKDKLYDAVLGKVTEDAE